MAAEVVGTVESGGTPMDVAAVAAAGAATEREDGGVACAVSDSGVAWVEGSTGAVGSAGFTPSAERATSELSAATGASFFHQASFCGI